MYRHLVCKQNVTYIKDTSLNIAVSLIEEHRRLDGIIVHFTDDNGIYSIRLFDQMRRIRRQRAKLIHNHAEAERMRDEKL
ncbi:hypothetical protein OPV22_033690 [Ensete ventricosum]|uniref:Glycosyltransferases n=1 Tax=Ensete ventricosum TaxID=4639 RepID=A0AAV8PN61_ENSVE|nr:hypothetical protein OPV22_033690 [Ensete ventricosum]